MNHHQHARHSYLRLLFASWWLLFASSSSSSSMILMMMQCKCSFAFHTKSSSLVTTGFLVQQRQTTQQRQQRFRSFISGHIPTPPSNKEAYSIVSSSSSSSSASSTSSCNLFRSSSSAAVEDDDDDKTTIVAATTNNSNDKRQQRKEDHRTFRVRVQRYRQSIQIFIQKCFLIAYKRYSTTIVIGGLLTFVLGYQIGTTKKSSLTTIATKQQRPPIVLSSLVLFLVGREIWRLIPIWLQKQISKQIPLRKTILKMIHHQSRSSGVNSSSSSLDDNIDDDDDDDNDDDDLTSIATIQKKLSSVWQVISTKATMMVEEEEENNITTIADIQNNETQQQQDKNNDNKNDYGMLYYLAILWKITRQLKDIYPELRDQRYQKSGRVINDESTATTTTLLQGLDDEFEFADMAYDELPNDKTLKEALLEKGYTLLRHDNPSLPGSVSHYIAMNSTQKQILIGVKGTSSLEDILTDLCGQAVSYTLPGPFFTTTTNNNNKISNNNNDIDIDNTSTTKNPTPKSNTITKIRCHEGIILAAKRLTDDLIPFVKEFFLPNKYKIRIVGHSLGAATAVLCGLLLLSQFPEEFGVTKFNDDDDDDDEYYVKQRLEVLAFGSPPILDYDSALACQSFCTTIINNSDIIPRASVSNLVVTMELVRVIKQRMKEKGFDNPTKDWDSIMSFWQTMFSSDGGKSNNDSTDNDTTTNISERILDGWEFEEELERAQKTVKLRDPDHLYCPGRVLHLYDYWSQQKQKRKSESEGVEIGEQQQEEVNAIIDKEEDATMLSANAKNAFIKEEAKTTVIRTAEGLIETDGTSKVLRWIEIDDRMFSDHLSPAYRSSLKLLLQREMGA